MSKYLHLVTVFGKEPYNNQIAAELLSWVFIEIGLDHNH